MAAKVSKFFPLKLALWKSIRTKVHMRFAPDTSHSNKRNRLIVCPVFFILSFFVRSTSPKTTDGQVLCIEVERWNEKEDVKGKDEERFFGSQRLFFIFLWSIILVLLSCFVIASQCTPLSTLRVHWNLSVAETEFKVINLTNTHRYIDHCEYYFPCKSINH